MSKMMLLSFIQLLILVSLRGPTVLSKHNVSVVDYVAFQLTPSQALLSLQLSILIIEAKERFTLPTVRLV